MDEWDAGKKKKILIIDDGSLYLMGFFFLHILSPYFRYPSSTMKMEFSIRAPSFLLSMEEQRASKEMLELFCPA